ncbi:MAG TPA: glycosyltransferase family 4 protein [Lysobacter sp.]
MKFMFFANTDWYLYNFRLSTALHLKQRGADVVMLSPPGPFGDRFAEHGIRWITLPMERASLNPAREALTLREIVRVLSSERPDLLHNFTVKCAVYGALAAKLARIPAVVNAVAGLGYVFTSDALMARSLRPVVKVLMRGTLGGDNSRLVLQNPDDANAFVDSKLVPEHHIRLIRSSGVDTNRFTPSRRDDQQRPLRVLLAARLLWEKGVQEFVDAAALVQGRGRSMEFLLAGSPDPGNPRSVDRRHVESWVRQGLVKWLGHVEDMPALLRSVDVMALPSYYREGVPKSLIEGAACGLALVTTNLPGCREVVSCHGSDGLHAEPRDAASLAELLIRLDDDRELLRRLGDAARRRALADFDERLVISRTLEVYQELLADSGWEPGGVGTEATRRAA